MPLPTVAGQSPSLPLHAPPILNLRFCGSSASSSLLPSHSMLLIRAGAVRRRLHPGGFWRHHGPLHRLVFKCFRAAWLARSLCARARAAALHHVRKQLPFPAMYVTSWRASFLLCTLRTADCGRQCSGQLRLLASSDRARPWLHWPQADWEFCALHDF